MEKRYSAILLFFLSSQLFLAANNNDGNSTEETKENKKISATFHISSIHVSKDGMVNWTSVSENGSLPYIVEQYIFDKWVKVAEIDGIGTSNANSYSCQVLFHNGDNKFRVKQKGYDRVARYSDVIVYNTNQSDVLYQITDHNQRLWFSYETFYMIYDPYGEVVSTGFASSVNIADFEKGNYCLIYDNKLAVFQKKQVILKNTIMPIVL